MNVIPLYDSRRIVFSVTANDVPGMRGVTSRNIAGRMRLSTESDKAITLTLTGVKAGSEVYIFDANRNQLAGTESATDPQSFTLSHYATGNPLNNVRILIASLGYENVDLSFTLTSNDASIPIQQRIDRNYKNP